jgi:predicted lipoprotein with Yx(FWY)xxD motif
MRKPVAYLFLLPLALVLSACSNDQTTTPAPAAGGTQPPAGTQVGVADTELGKILTDSNGRTLYAFTVDKDGKSACYQQCAQAWPALTTKGTPTAAADADGSLLATAPRTDGNQQVTYAGLPLYYFAKDSGSGQTNGQGVGGVWFVVDPAGKLVKTGAAAAAATVTLAKSKLGEILADAKGRTLYAFTVDKGSTSACYGACATTWPALMAKGKPTVGAGLESSLLGTTTRTDGNTQVTYKGMPLYYFAGDTKPSDTKGQALNKVWWVVASDGALVKSAP